MAKYQLIDLVGKDVHVTKPTVVNKIGGYPDSIKGKGNEFNNVLRKLNAGDFAWKIKTFIGHEGKQYLILEETTPLKTKSGTVMNSNVGIEYNDNVDEGKLKEQGTLTVTERQKKNEEDGKGFLERSEDNAVTTLKWVGGAALVAYLLKEFGIAAIKKKL